MDVITKRPDNPIYRSGDLPGTPPDLIVRLPFFAPDCQYLCWRNYRAGTDNHWKICRVKEINGDTQFQYPFGCDGYNFNPEHIIIYEGDEYFEYRR
jgi:hypothetical protein